MATIPIPMLPRRYAPVVVAPPKKAPDNVLITTGEMNWERQRATVSREDAMGVESGSTTRVTSDMALAQYTLCENPQNTAATSSMGRFPGKNTIIRYPAARANIAAGSV